MSSDARSYTRPGEKAIVAHPNKARARAPRNGIGAILSETQEQMDMFVQECSEHPGT